jgi:hypothetical protein
MTYKIIFENGITETIEAESIEMNDVLDKVEIKGEDGEELEEVYLNIDHVSAIIPQD